MKQLLVLLVRFYQYALSPWLGRRCRFFPQLL
jgi:putative component of membrane protein insertase Oxa1/YidC/SpoIIIJ protein YidD